MVVEESFVTRKPLEFTLLVLFIILVIITPYYLYLEFFSNNDVQPEKQMITESFNEVMYHFDPESDLSAADKRILFRLEYEGKEVQWRGNLLSCQELGTRYRVSVDHKGTGFADVVFTTTEDCTSLETGTEIKYRMELVDWKTTTFVGKEGEIL